ncbi:MAG: 2-oxo acid dehydrogenase subunit E2, partial [Acidimicrobiia bacterium]
KPTAPRADVDQLHDGDEIVPFTHIRQVTADHLMRSLSSAAQAVVSMQVDYGRVDEARSNTDLTYLPFVSRAVIDALGAFPHLNATVRDDDLIVHRHVHLAFAVDLDSQGLVTPVVHGAQRFRLRALADAIGDISVRARNHTLTADDVHGGTFTITNVGKFGTSMSIPIINHPQAAILAVDGIAMRPVTVGTAGGGYGITVRPTGNLTLTFDHRAVDGAYAAAFLARVRSILEDRSWSDEL